MKRVAGAISTESGRVPPPRLENRRVAVHLVAPAISPESTRSYLSRTASDSSARVSPGAFATAAGYHGRGNPRGFRIGGYVP